jgi:GT2 family glycosyltransferase
VKVAVCIVTFRNIDDVRACLAALERSNHAYFDVVVCENGGADAFARLRSALPDQLGSGQPVRLIDAGGNVGYAGGVNRAITAAPDADAWWVLNPDTQPAPDALARMVERLQEGDAAAVGSVVAGDDGRVQSLGGRWRKPMARPEALGCGAPVGGGQRERVEATQDYLSGASMLVGRRFVETVGLMREDYFLYCEEVEWCLRAKAAGLKLGFAPDAVVIHDAGSTTGSGAAMRRRPKLPVYLNHRNQILLTRDLFPAWTPVAAVGMLAVFALRYARRGAWRQLGFALEGWAAGLKGERGPPAWAPV